MFLWKWELKSLTVKYDCEVFYIITFVIVGDYSNDVELYIHRIVTIENILPLYCGIRLERK